MPHSVRSLFVFATNRSEFILNDQLAAIEWACDMPHHVVVVDDAKKFGEPGTYGNYSLIHSTVPSMKHLSGFKNNEAVKFAIKGGIEFDQVVFLDDDALPIGKGVDSWSLERLAETDVDLLGAQDRLNYQEYWGIAEELFDNWGVKGLDNFYPASDGVFYATCFMSRRAAEGLYEAGLLVPEGCEHWPLWPDPYISWAVQSLGFYQMCWGHMDRPRPPLYLNHLYHMRYAPAPWVLRDDFALYHSVRGVSHYSEEFIRTYYKRLREGRVISDEFVWDA